MKYIVATLLLFIFVQINAQEAGTPFFPRKNAEGLWEYVDSSGEIQLTLKDTMIDNPEPFSDGRSAAMDKKTQLYGFINTKGKWAIQPKYTAVTEFIDGVAIARKPCQSCYLGSEGLLSMDDSYVIDLGGKVLMQDNSQDSTPYKRYFFDVSLGKGLIRVIFGYGYNDMKNVMTLEGKILGDTYSTIGWGDIVYIPELDILKCNKQFIDRSGKVLLDLELYDYVGIYSDGYIWAEQQEMNGDEVGIAWHVLLDVNGKEVARFNDESYRVVESVTNGTFRYQNSNFEPRLYNLATKTSSVAPEEETIEGLDYSMDAGPKLPSGIRLVYTGDGGPSGFITTKGELIQKY